MNENIKERFYKHRRNTMLIALIAIFILLAGGEIKQISILGATIDFTQSKMPVRLFMLSLAYMFIKYFQFLHEIGGTGILEYVITNITHDLPTIAKKSSQNKEGKDNGYQERDYTIIRRNGNFRYVMLRSTENSATTPAMKNIAKGLGDEISIGPKNLWTRFIRHCFSYAVKTTWFGEYIVPILLAIIAFSLFIFGAPNIIEFTHK